MQPAPARQATTSAATNAEITRIFNNLVFGNDLDATGSLNHGEDMLYHKASAYIDQQDKLSKHIPSPPKQLLALMRELEAENTDFDKVQDIVREDLGLIGEIIKVCNSPLYRPRSGEINSIDKAISMLGLDGVMKVASVVMMRRVNAIESPRYQALARKMWNYCLKCAEACQMMGAAEDAFTHYLLGLIHNIGSITVFSCFIDLMKEGADKIGKEVDDLKVIQQINKESASWLSTLVAAEWQMPERYLETLVEYDRVIQGKMDDDCYALRTAATRILEMGTLCAQIHTLVKSEVLDLATGTAGLIEIGISEQQIDKIFSRFDLADESAS